MKSKDALDKIIRKSRVHLYKPVQIAEILYHCRKEKSIDATDLESYRNASKKWRDSITKRLVGRISTSSQKFQDNLFDANAMPPFLLRELADFNNKSKGLVENYIYHRLKERLAMVSEAMDYIIESGVDKFELEKFLSMFVQKPGLRRSVDKAYEITVYALFAAIVRALKVEVSMSIENLDKEILNDFDKFVCLVLGLSKKQTSIKMPAKLFRVGITNAADRGLDMWANFGPALQVKHISLTKELAEDVSAGVSADKIVLVCRDGEAKTVEKIMKQMPFSDRIQGIITLSDLTEWYKICLSKKYKKTLGVKLLGDLQREFGFEFPSKAEIGPFIKERGYNSRDLKSEWKLDKAV